MLKIFENKEEGFTILEVMFSIVILAFGLLGIAALQVSAIRGNSFGHHLNEATERIESRFDFLRNQPFDDVDNEEEDEDAEGYTRTTVVQDDTPIEGAKTVTVSVAWKDKSGVKDHSITLQTIISE